MDKKELVKMAKAARDRAYAPYSGCLVGAALLCADGSVYLGANQENASFAATLCAERAAFSAALLDGKREFTVMAVAGGKGEKLDSFPPCGVCRQVMAEFCSADFTVLCAEDDGFSEYKLRELLPHGFSGNSVR